MSVTVHVTSGHSDDAPFLGIWESPMDGFTSAAAQSGPNIGSADVTSVSGHAIVALGNCAVTGHNRVVLVMQDGTPQNFFSTVQITKTGGPTVTYNLADAQFSNTGELVLGLVFSQPGPTWVWTDDANTTFSNGVQTTVVFGVATSITLGTPVPDGSLVDLSWTTSGGPFSSFSVYRNGVAIATGISGTATSYTDSSIIIGDQFTYEVRGILTADGSTVISNDEAICADVFNCNCESVSTYDTLANVRKAVIINLGYPNQTVNPPPGLPTLVDQALRDAQKEIYRQLQRAALRTERFFRWTMRPGQRYYGLTDNDNCCDARLDPYKLTWVGFQDLNAAWYRLDEGIPPEYYTRANINFGWPTRFEVRQCIEIFPAPQAAYTLWVKGDFGLGPLTADSDRFTIDDFACQLLATGNLKLNRGAMDAQAVLKQAQNYILGLCAGSHGTKRYVPRAMTENPLTPPKFLPLGNDQA